MARFLPIERVFWSSPPILPAGPHCGGRALRIYFEKLWQHCTAVHYIFEGFLALFLAAAALASAFLLIPPCTLPPVRLAVFWSFLRFTWAGW